MSSAAFAFAFTTACNKEAPAPAPTPAVVVALVLPRLSLLSVHVLPPRVKGRTGVTITPSQVSPMDSYDLCERDRETDGTREGEREVRVRGERKSERYTYDNCTAR
jgi:hypothetical protein